MPNLPTEWKISLTAPWLEEAGSSVKGLNIRARGTSRRQVAIVIREIGRHLPRIPEYTEFLQVLGE